MDQWARFTMVPEGAAEGNTQGAQLAKLHYPHGSLAIRAVYGALYRGELSAGGQPHGLGATFHPDGSPHATLLIDETDAESSGRWVEGNLHGRASMLFTNGRYEGAFHEGQMEGLGVISWKSGERYEGEWAVGKFSGLGVQWNKDGELVRCGRWAHGEFVECRAVPLRLLPEGTHLSAAAQQAKRDHPNASALIADGTHYIGPLNADGQPHGQGASFRADGAAEMTPLVDAADAIHSGGWVNGKLEGRATQTFVSGDRYDGSFKHGRREGLGVYSWKSGTRFEGEFLAGSQSLGVFWSSAGVPVGCGRFDKGEVVEPRAVPLRLIPEGKFLSAAALKAKRDHPDDSALLPGRMYYIGPLDESGQPHGQGAAFHPDGSPAITLFDAADASQSGRWVNGKLQGRATHLDQHYGQRYECLYKDGRRDGLGVLNRDGWYRFEGQWSRGKMSGMGAHWNKDGKLTHCGRWADDKLVESCAVPVRFLPDKRWLSDHAKTASLLFPDGSYFVGPINSQNQRDGVGEMFSAKILAVTMYV